MRILQHCFRVYVETDALENAIAFYEQAQDMKCERRVKIVETGVEAAKIGGFLVLSGSAEKLAPIRHVEALFYVDSLDAFVPWLRANGAEIIVEPRTVTGGRNLHARNPDGLVVEYFEAGDPNS